MHKPFIDALMTNDLTKICRATVARSATTTHRTLIPQDLPAKCMHTLVHAHAHTHKVRKDLTVSIKNEGGLFQQVLQKVTKTYQRLRHKAAFLKPTDTSTSNR